MTLFGAGALDLGCFRRDRGLWLAVRGLRLAGASSDRLADGFRIGTLDTIHRAALDGDALHVAALRKVVVDRVVLGRPVVPHDQGVRRPVMPELIFGDRRLLV